MKEQIKKIAKGYNDNVIHLTLSYSYTVFLVAVVIGAIFHSVFNFQIITNPVNPYVGFILIILGSLLIYWAQNSTKANSKWVGKTITEDYFKSGPYKYSRSPTHFGLFIMTLGLGLLFSSFFVILFVTLAYIFTKIFFLKKEETILEKKYGQVYTDYKNKLSSWI